MDKHKTQVTFYVEKDGEILAYFPKLRYYGEQAKGTKRATVKTGYAHIGQHTAVMPEYVRTLRRATPQQYADLRRELEGIGYNLEIND